MTYKSQKNTVQGNNNGQKKMVDKKLFLMLNFKIKGLCHAGPFTKRLPIERKRNIHIRLFV